MKLRTVVFATASLVACCHAADQDILTILGQQSGIQTFINLLEGINGAVDVLNQGTFSGTMSPLLTSAPH
jgi:hypothetical protein